MLFSVFGLALLAAKVVSPSPAAPPPTCVSRWFAKAGPAPQAPPKPEQHATAAQRAAYDRAAAAQKHASARYASEAKAFGQGCILGDKPRKQLEAPAAAASLLEAYVSPNTSFVRDPPKDIADICPGYASASPKDKAVIWRKLFLAIIPPESGFNNFSMMLDGSQYSIGLYQVSLNNGCAVKTEFDLTDAVKNTACAVHIMERLERPRQDAHGRPLNIIGGDGLNLTAGAASYWSTLRARRAGPQAPDAGPRASIIAAVRDSQECRSKLGGAS